MKNKKKFLLWAGLVVILGIIFIPKIDFNFGSDQNTVANNPGARMITVNGSIVKPQTLENKIFSNGTLLSNEEVEIRSEITGKITAIHFEEGKRVKQEELLVKINDDELQATLKKNKARETLALDKEYRYKQLLDKNLTSQQEYDVALSELNSVLADIEYTEAQIAKTEIRAPFDGVVGLRYVSVGSYISPQVRIATLQDVNPIKVDFAVPQKYFGLIKQGKTIYVKLASAENAYKGTIYAVEPKIDKDTRTVLARAVVPNERGDLTPGAYVEIQIVLEELNNAVMVPTDVLVPDIEGEKVFVYKNGFAVPQRVKTGIRTENAIEIISGLDKGDTLIVSGIIQLRPNSPVNLGSIN